MSTTLTKASIHHGSDSIYILPGGTAPYQFGFFVVGHSSLGNTVDLSDTWAVNNGFYVFFGMGKTVNWQQAAQKILPHLHTSDTRRIQWLDQNYHVRKYVRVVHDKKQVTNANVGDGNIAIQLLGGTVTATSQGLQIAGGTMSLQPNLFNSYADTPSLPIDTDTGIAIQINATACGQVSMPLHISPALFTGTRNGYNYYLEGINYYLKDTVEVNQVSQDFYTPIQFPVLRTSSTTSIHTDGYILPESLTDIKHTSFQWATPFTAIPTEFVTRRGQSISLFPTGAVGASGLMLHQKPYSNNIVNGAATDYGISLFGTYELWVDGETVQGDHELLCGLSGTEIIHFKNGIAGTPGDTITFTPGQSALVKRFPLNSNSNAVSDLNLLIDDPYGATPWVSIQTTGKSSYFSQPNKAALYDTEVASTFMWHYENPSAYFANHPGKFPVALHAGAYANQFKKLLKDFQISSNNPTAQLPNSYVNNNLGGYPVLALIENQIMSPARKQAIVASKSGAVPDVTPGPKTAHTTTTPQGLLVSVNETVAPPSWNWLLLARNSDKVDNSELKIIDPSPTIQSAFQTNQLFMVVSKEGALGTLTETGTGEGSTLFDNLITITGWPFKIDIGTPQAYGNYTNVMLFKFREGALIDLVKSPELWGDSMNFVGDVDDVNALSSWLVEYLEKVETEQDNPLFAKIYSVVTDEHWNGILALNVNIGIEDFPDALKGLLAGIDLSRFRAHHVGVDVSHIPKTLDEVDLESSLFALIDYVYPGYKNGVEPAPQQNGDYAFRVLTLKVLFENSTIKSFSSKLQLKLSNFFGDAVVQSTSHDQRQHFNTILLNGSYENHNGHPAYTFTEKGDNNFALNSKVLTNVDVLKAQFNTQVNLNHGNIIHSRFSLWGNMQYAELDKMDGFSYDNLYFSNLGIEMQFNMKNPSHPTFSFDVTHISFDPSNSSLRPESLVHNFPIKLKGLLQGTSEQTPKKLGYLTVDNPLAETLGETWYGLNYEISLGTLGALAADVGLTAHLLLAWSPNKDPQLNQQSVGVFIQLPGTRGVAPMFDLQDVLKLSMGDIQLAINHPATGENAYLLKISDIALKLLSLKFPPGTIGIYIFGNPAGNDGHSSLGWYAAYQDDHKKKKQT